jgi:hypothetical protein
VFFFYIQEFPTDLDVDPLTLPEILDVRLFDVCFFYIQEFPTDLDVDPLTLPEIHEHMIRSPPPTTWPKSPNFKVFRFPMQSSDDDSSQVEFS